MPEKKKKKKRPEYEHIRDIDGTYWHKQPKTGKWLYYDGKEWREGVPTMTATVRWEKRYGMFGEKRKHDFSLELPEEKEEYKKNFPPPPVKEEKEGQLNLPFNLGTVDSRKAGIALLALAGFILIVALIFFLGLSPF
jgi:hypothetical protein